MKTFLGFHSSIINNNKKCHYNSIFGTENDFLFKKKNSRSNIFFNITLI